MSDERKGGTDSRQQIARLNELGDRIKAEQHTDSNEIFNLICTLFENLIKKISLFIHKNDKEDYSQEASVEILVLMELYRKEKPECGLHEYVTKALKNKLLNVYGKNKKYYDMNDFSQDSPRNSADDRFDDGMRKELPDSRSEAEFEMLEKKRYSIQILDQLLAFLDSTDNKKLARKLRRADILLAKEVLNLKPILEHESFAHEREIENHMSWSYVDFCMDHSNGRTYGSIPDIVDGEFGSYHDMTEENEPYLPYNEYPMDKRVTVKIEHRVTASYIYAVEGRVVRQNTVSEWFTEAEAAFRKIRDAIENKDGLN